MLNKELKQLICMLTYTSCINLKSHYLDLKGSSDRILLKLPSYDVLFTNAYISVMHLNFESLVDMTKS